MTYYTTKESEEKAAAEAKARKAQLAQQEKFDANERKAAEKAQPKAAKKSDMSDYDKFMAEHNDLVEKRKAAEQAVWDHRQAPVVERAEAAAKATAKAAGKDTGDARK